MTVRLKAIIPQCIKDRLKRFFLSRRFSVLLKKNVLVSFQTVFEDHSVVNQNCDIYDSFIGRGTYIASDSHLSQTKIGRFCSIGQNVRTGLGRHPSRIFVSTHPAFFSPDKQAGFTFTNTSLFEGHKFVDREGKYFVEIGNDVWIGNEVMILDGIRIGDGAIIGARSIVTQNVEPYSVYAGVPARKLRYRFEKKYIRFLLRFKWWTRGFNWLRNNSGYFNDIRAFYRKFHAEQE
ncbi:MAG: CatB-related O-acetyltransferase [bacterium]|nr:CatB-related O-acetyltransferase [bacterium]